MKQAPVELNCKHCDVPICSQCVISKNHKDCDDIDIMENSKMKKEVLRKDFSQISRICSYHQDPEN